MTRPKTQLTSIDAFRVDVVTDNRNTVQAEVTVNDATGVTYCIGRGVSRRRPGDRWDPAVGETLAVARAFEDAAQTTRRKLDDLGFGDVDTVGRPNVDRPPYFELYANKPGFVESDESIPQDIRLFPVELRLNELEAAEDAAERKWLNEQRAAEEVFNVKTPAEAAAEKASRLNQVIAATFRAATGRRA